MSKRLIDVFLNGIALSSVHDRIIAIRVFEQPQEDEITYEQIGNMPGKRIVSKKRRELNITVKLKVRELYDMAERMNVINAVNTWAVNGGTMRVSYRGQKTLNVQLTKPAAPGDIRDYNTEIELVFTSDGWPYWLDEHSSNHQSAGASGSALLEIAGSAPALIDTAVYVIQPITYLNIQIANSRVKLTNLDIPSAGYITITHDNYGIMSVMYAGNSLYGHLSDDSDDRLITTGGFADASFETDGDVEIYYTMRGRWM